MPVATTCPFCNAAVSLTLPLPASRRVPCPRCGELVPFKGEDTLAVAAIHEPSTATRAAEPPLGQRNRNVALMVLGLMAFMAALAAGYALRTVEFRRSNDNKDKDVAAPAPTTMTPPADLAGLGYLPDDVHLIAGVHLSSARQAAPTRALLTQFGLDSRVLGVAVEDVDHLVIGASLAALPPRLTVVLRARRPIDAVQLREAIRAGRGSDNNDKTLYSAKLWPAGPDAMFWFPDDRTIVGALVKEHFDRLPARPNPFVPRFPAPLPNLLRERLHPESLAWAVLHVDADDATQNLLLEFLPLPADERSAWGKLRDLAVAARPDGERVVIEAFVRGRDAAATERLGEVIERSFGAAGVVLSERAKAGDGLRLAATFGAEALRKWANQFRDGRPK